jgi:transcriptional regulator with XRE-family HTH domain
MVRPIGGSVSSSLGDEYLADARQVELGRVLSQLVERSGYSRNQRKVAAAVGVSPGALSQYIHEQGRPSFRTLLALAEFFNVSLDYLVYGLAETTTVDYGPLARYVDHALADAQARASRHTALVAQLGQLLSRQIEVVAGQLASSPGAAAGFISDNDELVLESHSVETNLATMDLQYDLIEMEGAEDAAGRFLPVVAANIGKNRTYRILVRSTADSAMPVGKFRSTLASLSGGDKVHQYCQFRAATQPLANGFMIYKLDVESLAVAEPALHLRVGQYLDSENQLGCVIAPNGDSHGDLMMDARHLATASHAFRLYWATGTSV